MVLKVSAIWCPICGCIVFSRTRHDMRICKCGNCAIDGGLEYTKVNYHTSPVTVFMEIPQTTNELWEDWNQGRDQYGLLIPENIDE